MNVGRFWDTELGFLAQVFCFSTCTLFVKDHQVTRISFLQSKSRSRLRVNITDVALYLCLLTDRANMLKQLLRMDENILCHFFIWNHGYYERVKCCHSQPQVTPWHTWQGGTSLKNYLDQICRGSYVGSFFIFANLCGKDSPSVEDPILRQVGRAVQDKLSMPAASRQLWSTVSTCFFTLFPTLAFLYDKVQPVSWNKLFPPLVVLVRIFYNSSGKQIEDIVILV